MERMNDLLDIGDEVKCIDASIDPKIKFAVYKNYPVWIQKDAKYIIRDIFYNDDIVAGIVLQNRRNPPVYIPLLKRVQEPAFATWRFVKTKSALQIQEENESEGVDVLEITGEDLQPGKWI